LRYSILFLSKFSFSTFVKTSNVPGFITVILLQHKSNATALFFSNVGYHHGVFFSKIRYTRLFYNFFLNFWYPPIKITKNWYFKYPPTPK
jgi:hypothetical protein